MSSLSFVKWAKLPDHLPLGGLSISHSLANPPLNAAITQVCMFSSVDTPRGNRWFERRLANEWGRERVLGESELHVNGIHCAFQSYSYLVFNVILVFMM